MRGRRANRLAGLMAIGGFAAGLVVIAAPPSGAVDAPCVATVTPNPPVAGQNFSILVTGFSANETVGITEYFQGTPSAQPDKQADGSGHLTLNGLYVVQLAGDTGGFAWVGKTGGAACSVSYTISGSQATTTTTEATTTTTAGGSTTTTGSTPTTAPTVTTASPSAAAAAAVSAKPTFTG